MSKDKLMRIRLHEDAVEIACCLFNKELLRGETIDDAAEEIEAFLTSVAEEQTLAGAVNQRPGKADNRVSRTRKSWGGAREPKGTAFTTSLTGTVTINPANKLRAKGGRRT